MSHDHGARAGRRHLRPLLIAFSLVAIFMVVEAIAGWLTGSLALISDAGHMATDALGLGMAAAAIVAGDRLGKGSGHTFGLYRAEILAALANSILLFGVGGYVLYEAVQRLGDPPEVLSIQMAVVAAVGLIVNIIAWRLLRSGADESLNVEGVYLEVLADLIGSIGVLIAAVVIWATDWFIVDPIVAAAIGLFILPRASRLARKAIRILVQAAPEGLDIKHLESQLSDLSGVIDVHDLHVWTLTSDMHVGTVHLMTTENADPHPVLDQARVVLSAHGVAHATLQVEPESHTGYAEVS